MLPQHIELLVIQDFDAFDKCVFNVKHDGSAPGNDRRSLRFDSCLFKLSTSLHHSPEVSRLQVEASEVLDSPAYIHEKETLFIDEVIAVSHLHRIGLDLRLRVADAGTAETDLRR